MSEVPILVKIVGFQVKKFFQNKFDNKNMYKFVFSMKS